MTEARADTGPQGRAADPSLSAWVSAAAGTGKTRVLRDRVLRLLLEGTPPERILCLTYTKAAAAEMANRIHQVLGRWARMADSELAADLKELGLKAPNSETLGLARRLFAAVLETPGGMKIQTIHAFCQSVLARFPLEAEMAPHFALMDERTQREVARDAVDSLLSDMAVSPYPALEDSVALLARHCSDTGLQDLINALFAERARLLTLWRRVQEAGSPAMDTILAKRLGFDGTPVPERILADACAEGAFDRAGLRRVAETLLTANKTDKEKGEKIAHWLSQEENGRIADFDTYCRAFFKDNGEPYKTALTKAAAAKMPEAEDILKTETARLEDVRDALNRAEVWRASSALHRLGEWVVGPLPNGRYETLKIRQALMDYTDLILKTRALFSAPNMAPWVLYKLDGGIDHVLVDEAQDTSPEQWDIIDCLVEEFFAGEGARDVRRTVFAVGDFRQSIYRFQGADPDQFEKYQGLFHARAENAGQPFREEALTLTYRTAKPVLDMVNAVFAQTNETARTDTPGVVELWPVESSAPGEAEAPWAPPVVQHEVDDPMARTAKRIAGAIEDWLAAGETVTDTETGKARAIRPGDIMVLVRRRNEFVGHMIRQLKSRGIAVAGADRMVLTEQLSVMDLMALGQFALLPEDDLTLAAILKGPMAGLDDDALYSLAHGREGTLWEVIKARRAEPRVAPVHAFLNDLLAQADMMPPYEFFSHILTAHDGRRRIVARLGTDALDPMEEFLSLALQFERTHAPSLQEFLHWMTSGSFEVRRESDSRRDEVRVMTVHGAKGLEAPVVFLPDTCNVPEKSDKLLWLEDEGTAPVMLWSPKKDLLSGPARTAHDQRVAADMAEYDRLLYVAMTRARDRLYVTGWEKKSRNAASWYDRIAQGFAALGDDVVRIPRADDTEIWRYGAVPTPGEEAGQEEPAVRETASPLPDWVRQPPPAEPSPPRPLAPSRPAEEEPPVTSPGQGDAGVRFRRGRLIHRLLELLPELAPHERRAAGERFLAQQAAELDEAERAAYLDEVMAVIDDPAFAVFFGPASAAEVPVIGLADGRAVSGQVDRLAVTGESVHVIDYKTNRPAPETVDDVPGVYIRQMAAYARVLGDIYPDKRIECALLWTDGPRLLVLPEERLAGASGAP